jgi:hypothetical protein
MTSLYPILLLLPLSVLRNITTDFMYKKGGQIKVVLVLIQTQLQTIQFIKRQTNWKATYHTIFLLNSAQMKPKLFPRMRLLFFIKIVLHYFYFM